MLRWACILVFALTAAAGPARGGDVEHTVDSLAELERLAQLDGQSVTMKPGVYKLTDLIPLDAIDQRRRSRQFHFLNFAGSDNAFHLDGVTIEVDTRLRAALRPPIHTDEFIVTGDGNTIEGLTITNVGEGASMGGCVFAVAGERNVVRGCTLHVRGSSPYGYGDLFGKGGRKHGGLRVIGDRNRVIDCKVFMHAFGHGFYVQDGADDTRFEGCHVEGVMRSTDDMLAETSGLAFDREFRTELTNRAGERRVTQGYMKALAEDGFRTYGGVGKVTLVNCTARHMRGGFELREPGASVTGCAAIGCERGFWLGDDARVTDCRGDARHGPLLFVEGKNAHVQLTLMAAESESTVHALATICGVGHRVTIRPSAEGARKGAIPIMVGYTPPPAGEGMAPYNVRAVRDLTLVNRTAMPVIVEPGAGETKIDSVGAVTHETAGDGAR